MKEYKQLGMKPTRHGFGDGLVELGERNDNVVVFGGDITGSVLTSFFKERFPERFFSIGIAEANATTIAAGFALSGKIAVFSSYSAFSAFRNSDQIRVSLCYNNANVKIGGGHSGITVGPDGATHQSLEEVAFLRALPNMTVVVPADYQEAKSATVVTGEAHGPVFIRFGRPSIPMFFDSDYKFQIGKAVQLTEGDDVAIIACGTLVWRSLQAAEELAKKGIKARVINCSSIKPLDVEMIVKAAMECGCIVTAEEHQIYGGLGGAVAEAVVKNFPVPMEFIGMKDRFGESGEPEELMEKFGFNAETIVSSAMTALKRKDKGFIGLRSVIEY